MNSVALFIRHRAKPGRRDAVLRIWEQWVKPRAKADVDHLSYYFCYDNEDPDTICVFQLYRDEAAMQRFMPGDWYPQYPAEIAEVVADPPQIQPASLVWQKDREAAES